MFTPVSVCRSLLRALTAVRGGRSEQSHGGLSPRIPQSEVNPLYVLHIVCRKCKMLTNNLSQFTWLSCVYVNAGLEYVYFIMIFLEWYLFCRAAVTKGYKLYIFKLQNYSLTVLETRSPKSGCWQGPAPSGALGTALPCLCRLLVASCPPFPASRLSRLPC